jgi:hypothetical protein
LIFSSKLTWISLQFHRKMSGHDENWLEICISSLLSLNTSSFFLLSPLCLLYFLYTSYAFILRLFYIKNLSSSLRLLCSFLELDPITILEPTVDMDWPFFKGSWGPRKKWASPHSLRLVPGPRKKCAPPHSLRLVLVASGSAHPLGVTVRPERRCSGIRW